YGIARHHDQFGFGRLPRTLNRVAVLGEIRDLAAICLWASITNRNRPGACVGRGLEREALAIGSALRVAVIQVDFDQRRPGVLADRARNFGREARRSHYGHWQCLIAFALQPPGLLGVAVLERREDLVLEFALARIEQDNGPLLKIVGRLEVELDVAIVSAIDI